MAILAPDGRSHGELLNERALEGIIKIFKLDPQTSVESQLSSLGLDSREMIISSFEQNRQGLVLHNSIQQARLMTIGDLMKYVLVH